MDNNKNESLVKKGSLWFPEKASTEAYHVDSLFNFILWASIIMFIGITAVLVYFVRKFKRTKDNMVAQAQIIHNVKLEIIWTVIPLIITLFIFYWGIEGYFKMTVPPSNAMEIRVTAKKWMWQFDYASGTKSIGELVVPVDTPIKLVMSSEDVIHSFYAPNFRIKRDVIPNRYTRIWFEANRTGQFQIFCTEYCGDGHSDMMGTVRVLSGADYEKWLKEGDSGADMPLDKLGEKVYNSKGCATCHSTDGSAKTGPSWKGLYGSTRNFNGGGSTKADDNYIRESIVKPAEHVVAGYQPVMPTFAGILNDREINGVIEYIKTLK